MWLLWHPLVDVAFTPHYRIGQWPTLVGSDTLGLAITLLGLAAYRAWWLLSLDVEAERRRARRHHRHPPRRRAVRDG